MNVFQCLFLSITIIMTMKMRILGGSFLFLLLPTVAFGQTILDSFRGDIRSCEMSCENSFPGHKDNEEIMFSICRRGCRIFNLIDILDDFNNLNDTKKACCKSCDDSYSSSENLNACILGCESQVPDAKHRKQQMKEYYDSQKLNNLAPTLYVNTLYSNMIEKGNDRMSRSYYNKIVNGGLVVIAAKSYLSSDIVDSKYGDNLYNYMDSHDLKPGGVDLSTLDAKGSLQSGVNNEEEPSSVIIRPDSDVVWHTCIIVKAGTSRLIITCMVLLLIMLVVWLWANSVATLPQKECQDRINVQHNLKHLPCSTVADDGDSHMLLFPSQHVKFAQAHPVTTAMPESPSLPIKIKIESV